MVYYGCILLTGYQVRVYNSKVVQLSMELENTRNGSPMEECTYIDHLVDQGQSEKS